MKLCAQRVSICSSRKYSHPPQGRLTEILRGGGGEGERLNQQQKCLKEAKLEFQRGEGGQNEKPSMGGVWIFSGTTQ